jgi:conjugal transfer pilus assembly protein TraE
MEYKTAQTTIDALKRWRQYLLIFCGGLVICNGLFALLLWQQSQHRQVILVPMGLHKTAVMGRGYVSPSYLEQTALFFVYERLNVTPGTVDASHQLVLKHTTSAYYAAFKSGLLTEKKLIQSQKIASVFYLNQLRVDPGELRVMVSGHLERWVGERSLGVTLKTYDLHFIQQGGELLLTAFHERGSDEKSI